jgi:fructose-bisphosphate aldolase class II
MRWADGRELVDDAKANGYALGAFNVHNEETAQAILRAAQEAASPVFVQIGRAVIEYLGLKKAYEIIRSCAEEVNGTGCIHLDHSRTLDEVAEALKLGLGSIMYDGAHLSLEENIANARRVVEVAHFMGVAVEAELGQMPHARDAADLRWEDYYTDVDEAARFVEETNVDYLAIQVGAVHGVSATSEPRLDLERIGAIAKKTGIPLVLHGASGIPDDMARQAIAAGIAKLNVDTDLRVAFREGMQAVWSEDDRHLEDALAEGRSRMQAEAVRKMQVFGSAGRTGEKLLAEGAAGRRREL